MIATEAKIPIMRNIDLALELYRKGRIGDYIPKDTYKAVAEILKWLKALEEKEKVEFLEFLKSTTHVLKRGLESKPLLTRGHRRKP